MLFLTSDLQQELQINQVSCQVPVTFLFSTAHCERWDTFSICMKTSTVQQEITRLSCCDFARRDIFLQYPLSEFWRTWWSFWLWPRIRVFSRPCTFSHLQLGYFRYAGQPVQDFGKMFWLVQKHGLPRAWGSFESTADRRQGLPVHPLPPWLHLQPVQDADRTSQSSTLSAVPPHVTPHRAPLALTVLWAGCTGSGITIVTFSHHPHGDRHSVVPPDAGLHPVPLRGTCSYWPVSHARRTSSLPKANMRGAITLTVLLGVFIFCWAPCPSCPLYDILPGWPLLCLLHVPLPGEWCVDHV